ncbi:CidA/LrgA family protein [Massilia sp. H6]|uniref:CidA/LrgA family protein n=1 Tax=Massilia sp. H6 TaxID=2970464 RepID=UPI0021689F4A|nr:CidA/LrgA family protein [Massilia sp. H6]UVW27179.1 CidA/LrgA family protein [Massilia sp. H6]
MLPAFTILLLFQCLGEGIVFMLGLALPGPVAGMLLLMAALVAHPPLLKTIEEGANTLLSHLSLLFVPAGVGIVATAASGSGHWFAILAALVASTVLALAVTGLMLRGLGTAKDGDA